MIFSLFWEGAFIIKIRDFRGRSFEGGVYSRRGVYSRKYGIIHHFRNRLKIPI